MTINIGVFKGDLYGKCRSGAFLFLLGIYFGCSKEQSHEYPRGVEIVKFSTCPGTSKWP